MFAIFSSSLSRKSGFFPPVLFLVHEHCKCLQFFLTTVTLCDVSRSFALVSEVKSPHFHREANAVNNGCERINRKTPPLSSDFARFHF